MNKSTVQSDAFKINSALFPDNNATKRAQFDYHFLYRSYRSIQNSKSPLKGFPVALHSTETRVKQHT